MTFESLTLPAAQTRYALSGPAGQPLDTVVASLIGAGCAVECIEPTTRYRIDGPADLLAALADELGKVEGFTLAIEAAPTDRLILANKMAPARDPVRTTFVHGANASAFAHVARAVDRGLTAASVGVNRWAVSGNSAAQMRWLADAQGVSLDDVLTAWQTTAEQITAEDAVQPIPLRVSLAPITVNLPPRKTTSVIDRDGDGNITNVKQTSL